MTAPNSGTEKTALAIILLLEPGQQIKATINKIKKATGNKAIYFRASTARYLWLLESSSKPKNIPDLIVNQNQDQTRGDDG